MKGEWPFFIWWWKLVVFSAAVLRVLLFQLCQILIGFLFRLEAHLWSLGAEL